MSFFTVLIIIGAVYQLYTAVTKKKGPQETPGELPDSHNVPGRGFNRDVIQGTSGGTWREQLKQALDNVAKQAESLQSIKPKAIEVTKDHYVQTVNTQATTAVPGTAGTQGASGYVGIIGAEAYKSKETPSEGTVQNPFESSGIQLSLTEKEVVQGVMWAEILGKPRAMRPFRGPRT